MKPTKILVVDDSPFFRSFLSEIIQVRGLCCKILEADDGIEAVKKYQKFHPDLVMLDVRMPKANGVQALRAILKTDPLAKVIMVSSVKEESLVNQAKGLGALGYIKKPFNNIEVAEMITRVINYEVPLVT